jgi:hypothetical protein
MLRKRDTLIFFREVILHENIERNEERKFQTKFCTVYSIQHILYLLQWKPAARYISLNEENFVVEILLLLYVIKKVIIHREHLSFIENICHVKHDYT